MVSTLKYSSLKEYYNDTVKQMVEKCDLCGNCVKDCPIFPATSIKDKASKEIMGKIINLLKNGVFSKEALIKAYSCASCGHCSVVCPQGIDVMEAFGAARIKLIRQGKQPEAVNLVGGIPNLWKDVSAIIMKLSSKKWIEKIPSQPEKTENVLFWGCTLQASPHIAFALLDVLEKMNIDFVALSGGELCCGFPFFAAGKVEELEKKARELVTNIKFFSPKRVILPCAGCYRQFTKLYPLFQEMDFEVKYYFQFLNDNIKKIKFTTPLTRIVYFQDSCMSRSNKCNESVKNILENIPGLKVVKGQNICCGGTPKLAFPEIPQKLASTFRETITEDIVTTKADCLVNLCQLCEMSFSPSIGKCTFTVKDPAALINEAMGGIEYKSIWPELLKCQSGEEITEKYRENIEANSLTEEEVKNALPLILSWKM
jgi:Fe-S oxidoreductase